MRIIKANSLLTAALSVYGASAAVVDSAATSAYNAATEINKLPACPTTRNQAYDYIIVGAGAGGGPIAARLALKGFSVLLMDSGKDWQNVNTTIPLYLSRSTEDPEIALDYFIDQYPPGHRQKVNMWYPRAQGLGGSTTHNAYINQIPHKWDFDNIKTITGDASWDSATVMKYFTKIENNLYLPPDMGVPLGHGYNGWLNTQAPPSNLITDPKYYDQKLVDVFSNFQNAVPPIPGMDWTTPVNDVAEGGGILTLTKNANGTRSGIRDHLVATRAKTPRALVFQLETLVTKILSCKSTDGKIRAYGVSAVKGATLPVSPKFKGKYTSTPVNYYAKNEVIIASGTYSTPQLLMLSGIGPQAQLKKFNIPQLVSLPGVGENLQDRLEMGVIWNLKEPYVIWKNCKFLYTAATDPCMADWQTSGHTNIYSAGPASYAHSYKTSASLPYRDMWSMAGPGQFTGYHFGWGQELANNDRAWINVVLKGHTDARGWVRLTGNHIQDKTENNKNQGVTAGFANDVELVKQEMLRHRANMKGDAAAWSHVDKELWPGEAVTADKLTDFIEKNTWGHHICCTSKLGAKTDKTAVVDSTFKVFGIDNLRVVDNSVWANIPGFFVTTPIFMMSEKAADTVINYAASKGWAPTYPAVA